MLTHHIEGQCDERKYFFVLLLWLHFADEFVVTLLACELSTTSHLLEIIRMICIQLLVSSFPSHTFA
jgi:hypothetical protein